MYHKNFMVFFSDFNIMPTHIYLKLDIKFIIHIYFSRIWYFLLQGSKSVVHILDIKLFKTAPFKWNKYQYANITAYLHTNASASLQVVNNLCLHERYNNQTLKFHGLHTKWGKTAISLNSIKEWNRSTVYLYKPTQSACHNALQALKHFFVVCVQEF